MLGSNLGGMSQHAFVCVFEIMRDTSWLLRECVSAAPARRSRDKRALLSSPHLARATAVQLAFRLCASALSTSKMLLESSHCHSRPFKAVCTSSGLGVASSESAASYGDEGLLLQQCLG